MTLKETYNAAELAEALQVKKRKIDDLLRKGEIKHIHLNKSHARARIPKEEFHRLVQANKETSA